MKTIEVLYPIVMHIPHHQPGLRIKLEGFPTQCVDAAHQIANEILGREGAWHFTSLELDSPMSQGFGNNRDSAWKLTACAVVKNG
jgi:hypothetical protein